MAGAESKVAQAVERYREADRLSRLGFRERAVEALHLSAELVVDELAERHGIEYETDQGPHEARARAAQTLRVQGQLPAGYDTLLRRMNEDRKRSKYNNRESRFDPLTLAQAQASVRIMLDTLTPGALEPAPPESSPARRPLWQYAAAAGIALVAIAAAIVVATSGGGDEKPAPAPARRTAAPPVAYNAKATLAGLTYRVLSARTGKVLDFEPRRTSKRGVFVLVYADVRNPTDRILPLRFDAFRLRTKSGVIVSPALGLSDAPATPVRPNARQRLPLPYDVAVDQVPGSVLLVDRTSANGDHRSRGLTMDLELGDGLGELMPGTWTGEAANGRPFTMKVERGDVITHLSVTGAENCRVHYAGAAFVEDGAFKLGGDPEVSGRFATSSAAAGQVTGGPCGKLGWRASTSLR